MFSADLTYEDKLQDMELPIEKIAYAVEAGIDTVRGWLAEREEHIGHNIH